MLTRDPKTAFLSQRNFPDGGLGDFSPLVSCSLRVQVDEVRFIVPPWETCVLWI